MPTRVFSALDASTDVFTVGADGAVVDGVDGGTGVALSTLLTQTGVGSWQMLPNLNGSSAAGTATCSISSGSDAALIQEFTIDYTNFPAIPENARVKKLVFNRPRSVNYTFNATDGPNDNLMLFRLFGDGGFGDPIFFTPAGEAGFVNPTIVNETINGVAADEVIFDHTGGDTFITRAELISTYSQFDNNVFGILINCNSDGDNPPGTSSLAGSLIFGLGWTATVTYEEQYEWDLHQDTSPVDEGSTVNLTSPEGEALALNMEDIESIEIQFPDPGDPGTIITINVPTWTVIDENTLSFIVPSLGGYESIGLTIVVTSTQFSGDLALGQVYTVFLISAPGIYQLVPGQLFDRLYDWTDDADVGTIDVKIPNPFIKTGFVDG